MNIIDHIEAGHYPKDDKGRALVPMRGGGTCVVLATDNPNSPHWPISGFVTKSESDWTDPRCWAACGGFYQGTQASSSSLDLLPPVPRKVKVTRWAVLSKDGDCLSTWPTRASAHEEAVACRPATQIVELTGEYEEPWDK